MLVTVRWNEGRAGRVAAVNNDALQALPETVKQKLMPAMFAGIPQHNKSIIGTVKTLHFPHPGRQPRAILCTCCCNKKFFVYIPRDIRYIETGVRRSLILRVVSPDSDTELSRSCSSTDPMTNSETTILNFLDKKTVKKYAK